MTRHFARTGALLPTCVLTCLSMALGVEAIVVPARIFSAQGGNEVRICEPPDGDSAPDPGIVHFWHTPGHWLEWTVTAPGVGEYELSLRYAGKHDTQRSLAVNGKAVDGLDPFTLKRTGSWSAWQEVALPGQVALAAGRNVLRMACLDGRSVRMSDLVLAGPDDVTIRLKAAAFSGQEGGHVQVLTRPTLGQVDNWGEEGHWLEWSVEAPTNGWYYADLHYSADGYCCLEMQVNGKAVKGLEAFIPPYTGDERNWTLGTLPVPLILKKGRNVLRITTLGGPSRGVPSLNGEFALSMIRLRAGATGTEFARTDDMLELTTAAQVKRPDEPGREPDPAPLGPPLPAIADALPLEKGKTFALGDHVATLTLVDVLPCVENKFSKRYVFENYDNTDLYRLRREYDLDAVIAEGKDEFEQQLLLMKWVWDQWDFGHARERYDLRDPFEILEQAPKEHKFQCMHSAVVLMTAANALGWVCRPMAHPQHSFSEMWSNQHRKWIMFDATSNYYPEKDGSPLNTYEHRQALLREGGGVMRARMGETGMERSPQGENAGRRLLFVGYIPNTDHLVRGPDYAGFFITKDELCEDRKWHIRDCPENPAVDPYFPINQAALALVPEGNGVRVTLGTMTPNFKEFQKRIDDGNWETCETAFAWELRPGENRLEVRSVNKFNVPGPISTVGVELKGRE